MCNSLPLEDSNIAFVPQDALTKAENQKKDKYALLNLRNEISLVPFVLGSLGGFNDAAESLMAEFGRANAMSSCSSFSYAYHATLLRRKLSFVVQKCQANAIIQSR